MMIQKFLLMRLWATHPVLPCWWECKFYGSLWTAAQCFHPNNSPVILLPPLPTFLLFTADCLKGSPAFAFLMSSSSDYTDLVSAFMIPLKYLLLRSPMSVFHLHLTGRLSSILIKLFLQYFLTLAFMILCSLGFLLDLSDDWTTPFHSLLSAFLPLLCFFSELELSKTPALWTLYIFSCQISFKAEVPINWDLCPQSRPLLILDSAAFLPWSTWVFQRYFLMHFYCCCNKVPHSVFKHRLSFLTALKALKENPGVGWFYLFKLLMTICTSWLVAPFSVCKGQAWLQSFLLIITLPLLSAVTYPPASSYKDICDSIRASLANRE